MKTQTKAIVASLVVIALALSAATSVTYSWWTDSENTDIDITTGYLDVTTSDYALYDWTGSDQFAIADSELVDGGGDDPLPLPESISLSQLEPASANNEAKFMVVYTAIFTSSIDAKYYVQAFSNVDWITVIDSSDPTTTQGNDVVQATYNENAKNPENDVPIDDDLTIGSWTSFAPANGGYAYITAVIQVPIIIDLDQANMDKAATVSIRNVIVQDINDTVWDGTVGTMPAEDDGVYEIYTAPELAAFAKSVNEGNTYEGKTIKLMDDIDLNGIPWTPIGMPDINEDEADYKPFKGTFNGNEKTISNLYINIPDPSCVGFFGDMRGTVMNLSITGADVTGTIYSETDGIGIVAGYAYGTINNVIVSDSEVLGDAYVGGIAGLSFATITSCKVIDTSVSAFTGGDTVGGIVGYSGGSVQNNTVENVDITGELNLGCIAGTADATVSNNIIKGENSITVDWYGIEYRGAICAGSVAGLYDGVTIVDNTVSGTVEYKLVESAEFLVDDIKAYLLPDVIVEEKAIIPLPSGTYAIPQVDGYAGGFTIVPEDGAEVVIEPLMNMTLGDVKFKGVKFEYGSVFYNTSVHGDIIFEECVINATDVYAVNFVKSSIGDANVVFNNCVIYGWVSIGNVGTVEFNDCEFYGNGTYCVLRFYNDATLNRCTINATESSENTVEVTYREIGSVGVEVTLCDCIITPDDESLFVEYENGSIEVTSSS